MSINKAQNYHKYWSLSLEFLNRDSSCQTYTYRYPPPLRADCIITGKSVFQKTYTPFKKLHCSQCPFPFHSPNVAYRWYFARWFVTEAIHTHTPIQTACEDHTPAIFAKALRLRCHKSYESGTSHRNCWEIFLARLGPASQSHSKQSGVCVCVRSSV